MTPKKVTGNPFLQFPATFDPLERDRQAVPARAGVHKGAFCTPIQKIDAIRVQNPMFCTPNVSPWCKFGRMRWFWPTRGRGRPARQRFVAPGAPSSCAACCGLCFPAQPRLGAPALAYYLAGSATRTAPQRQRASGKLFLQVQLRLTPKNVTGNPFLQFPATFDPQKRDRQPVPAVPSYV